MLDKKKKEVFKEFAQFNTWEEKYKHLIKMGQSLSPIEDQLKTEENLVKGCQSQVWIFGKLNEEQKVVYHADSDALIVRGVVSLLLKVFSGGSPDEIIQSDLEFIKEIGFDRQLSPSRANGLYSMIKQIKYYAQAYKALLASQK
ncbi:MAG: SufE family protein [Bdellovibrionales bacterium]|nr:SufE family protein [Bdellovibrionales bacterium]